MLNPEYKINNKIFDTYVTKTSTREGFGSGLVAIGEVEPNVIVLSADLGNSTKADFFKERFPDRFIECGVAEQNMAAIASGLAVSGKIPYISSYATFSPGKNWETVRTTIIYNKANVKIAGHHAGVATGVNGTTHQGTEDLAITRCLPDLCVICPCDALQAHKVTIAAAYINSPVYIRFSRENTPIITTEDTPYDPNKAYQYWISDKPHCTIFATGYLLYNALLAAKELEKERIQVNVVNVVNIKPLDKTTILDSVKYSKCAVTVEDHQIAGGMGSALAELFAKHFPIPMSFIGLQDTFAESGEPDLLLKKYGMDIKDIIKSVKLVIQRK